MADAYMIRLARPDEVPQLAEIENEAGAMFSGLGLIDEALDVSFPRDDLTRLAGMGQVWVACPPDGRPVGMVIAAVLEGAVYVEEMDVRPGHGRRGLGARLLAAVCAWARAQGHPAVTLSTFRDVPWNGPFYRKHGFRDLPQAQWTPGMRAIREQEARHGLRVEARVFMRRELDGPGYLRARPAAREGDGGASTARRPEARSRGPMFKLASRQWKRLRRYLAADPRRFAGGSAVSDPLGLLAPSDRALAAEPVPVPGPGNSWSPSLTPVRVATRAGGRAAGDARGLGPVRGRAVGRGADRGAGDPGGRRRPGRPEQPRAAQRHAAGHRPRARHRADP